MNLSALAEVLGGKKTLSKNIQTRMDLIELSNTGITKDALVHLAKNFGCSVNQIAQLLPVTGRTVQRYKPEKPFNRIVSEHILQLAEVAARGGEVFKDKEQFIKWMNHPSKALDNNKPMNLLNSRFGTEMVLDEIGRIEHGVFS